MLLHEKCLLRRLLASSAKSTRTSRFCAFLNSLRWDRYSRVCQAVRGAEALKVRMSGDCPRQEPAALKALPALHVRFLAALQHTHASASSLSYTASTLAVTVNLEAAAQKAVALQPANSASSRLHASWPHSELSRLFSRSFPQSSGDAQLEPRKPQ